MGRTNYSTLNRDPYLRKRWQDKVNFNEFEYASYSTSAVEQKAVGAVWSTNYSVQGAAENTGLGCSDKSVQTSHQNTPVRNFNK